MYSLIFGKIEVFFYLVVKPSADVTAEKCEETNDLTLNMPGNRKRRIETPKVAEKSSSIHPSIHPNVGNYSCGLLFPLPSERSQRCTAVRCRFLVNSVIKASEKNRQRALKANELCFTAIFVFHTPCLTASVSGYIIPHVVHLSVGVKGG